MSRRYGHAISVACAAADAAHHGGEQAAVMRTPQRFVWRGVTYHVVEVLGTWHLRDRWWQPGPPGPAMPARGQARQRECHRAYQPDVAVPPDREVQSHRADVVLQVGANSDRYYYRVRCVSGLICELYYDAVSDAWVLDRVYD